MANVNDASNVRNEAQGEWDKLETANIDDRDRKAIDRYVTHRRTHGSASGSYAPATERDDLSKLRLSSKRAEGALVDMGIDDLNQLLDTLTTPRDDGGYGITTGIDAYTRALRPFYRWLDDHGEYGAYEWYEQISTGNVDFDDPSDREFPTQSDIDAIEKAAGQHGTMRDVALVAFFADTGVRRTLGAQLRVGDINLDSEPASFTPNPNGEAQKGVEVKPYPIFNCVSELRTWINKYHPDPENPDAPLWTHPKYEEFEDPDEGAIGARHINRLFKKFAEKAGVDDKEQKVHAYRHAAIGRWKERGYTLTQVQRRTAWKDQAAAEMWARYGDADDSAIDQKIAEVEGEEIDVDGDDETTAEPPERRTCGNCDLDGITSDHCPGCGSPVSPEAKQRAMERQEARKEVQQDVGAEKALNPENEEDLEEIANDDTILAKLIELRQDGE